MYYKSRTDNESPGQGNPVDREKTRVNEEGMANGRFTLDLGPVESLLRRCCLFCYASAVLLWAVGWREAAAG